MPSILYLLIFKILLQNEKAVNSAILAEKCNVSTKTINNSLRNTIKLFDTRILCGL